MSSEDLKACSSCVLLCHRLHWIKISVSISSDGTNFFHTRTAGSSPPSQIPSVFIQAASQCPQMDSFPQHPLCCLMQYRTTVSFICYYHRGVGEDYGAGGPRGWPAAGKHTKWIKRPTSETVKIHQKSKISVALYRNWVVQVSRGTQSRA